MADPKLEFDPILGWEDTTETVFKTNPSDAEVRPMFQRLFSQIRDFINGTLLTWIKSTFASKAEINNIVLGQIPDGSLTDVKLSDEAGQIKDRFNIHLTNFDNLELEFNNYGANIEKNASFTLSLIEDDKVIYMTGASAQVITVPDNATVSLPINTQITVIMQGTGTVTFAPASGVNLNSKDTKRTIDGQYAWATLIKKESDKWSLGGALK